MALVRSAAEVAGVVDPDDPSPVIRMPVEVPDEVRSRGWPICWLKLVSTGAVINVDFRPEKVMQHFVRCLAKKLKKHFDLQIGPARQGQPSITVRVSCMDARQMVLGTLANSKSTLSLGGRVIDRNAKELPFFLTHRNGQSLWIFAGSDLGLFMGSAKKLSGKIAKQLIDAWNPNKRPPSKLWAWLNKKR